MVKPLKRLLELGFKIVATRGTADFLAKHSIEAQQVNKVLEGRPHIVDLMKDGKVQLVFNTVDGAGALTDSFTLRRTALMHKIAYYTTVAGAKASVEGIAAVNEGALEVAPLQSYFKTAF
jgi:carbamoyl-phosphate synthase large subunit